MKICISHKHQIFYFSWENNGKICHLAASSWGSSCTGQPAPTWDEDLCSPVSSTPSHGHPSSTAPAGIRVCDAYSRLCIFSLSPHTGSRLGHSHLHVPPDCPFIILFPPSKQISRVYPVPGRTVQWEWGRKRGFAQNDWLPPSSLGSYFLGTGEAPLTPEMLPTGSACAWCSQSTKLTPQGENRPVCSSLQELEEITLPFWASAVPPHNEGKGTARGCWVREWPKVSSWVRHE